VDAPKPKKSERTRAAIVAAARRLFAEGGFDRTTVRDIGAAAGVDPALVVRYFGSKDRLFVESADIALKLPDLAQAERPMIGLLLARHFLELWEGEGNSGGLPVLLRSAASNENAAAQMREVFLRQVAPAISPYLRKDRVSDRAAMISSQLLGVALCRYVLRLPPLVAVPKDRLARMVGAALQKLAFDDLPE
jgi:AcrR family transcriptional regulator